MYRDPYHPANWKFSSPTAPGLHTVISPANSPLRRTWVFRLNLAAGDEYTLGSPELELNLGIVAGRVRVELAGASHTLGRKDSFYLAGGDSARIEALEGPVMAYVGGARYAGVGSSFVRRFDPQLPLGTVRQVHGQAPYRRDVFMTLDQQTPASAMINGFTFGDAGAWTSWPPHEHSAHLEEVYCYFDLDEPSFALHLSSRRSGTVEFVHPVHTGDCVIVPEGYHPTVGMPGCASSYFWIMAAHRPSSRRYDLAINDPAFT